MADVGRFLVGAKQSFFLFGPRGTGKSTWLRQAYPEALWIDLLLPDKLRQYASRPERLSQLLQAQPQTREVVIDEVQRVPALLDVVHQWIEAKRNLRFVLTGSSSRKLKRSGVNLLAGRALLKTMHPFMAAELGEAFSLPLALQQGMLPLVYGAEDAAQTLASYVDLYVKEEVQQEGIVRNTGNFARVVETLSFSHASLWNSAAVAREAEVPRRTVDAYLEILEDLLLVFRLPVFRQRAKRATVSHGKFYWADAGIFVGGRAMGPLDRREERQGAALEGLVAQHLRAWIDYRGQQDKLSFWRTQAGSEVDFVVYGPSGFWAIEVKHAATLHPQDFAGLRAFASEYPEAELRLLYRGRDRLRRGDVSVIPCDEYLRAVHPACALP